MRIFLTLLFISFLQFGLSAQFSDDFSDGNLTNPDWQGDVGAFEVNNDKALQLNASEAGTSMLYLPVTVPDSVVWEMWLKLDFSPSKSNQLQVYLLAENNDLENADALFLVIGENGNEDAIKVMRRNNGIEELITQTAAGSVSNSSIELKIIIEKLNNNWTLAVDYSGGNNYSTVADWVEPISNSGFFGLHCAYTATRKDKFYFDDISLQKKVPDTTPPSLAFAQASDSKIIILDFSEPISNTSLSVDQFVISNGIDVVSAEVLPSNLQVKLDLSQDLVNGQTYSITAKNISDVIGNSGDSNIDFLYSVVETVAPFDIVINEVFPDPKPTIGLPESEFIELYNRSNKSLKLKGITLTVNSSSKPLPDELMLPDSYLVLVDVDDLELWTDFDNVLGIDLPGLTNSGATISISTTEIIHEIVYTTAAYQDKSKKGGGWSLELINPDNPCLAESNWIASSSLQGGTPGKINSVFDLSHQADALHALRVSPVDESSVVVVFDQTVGADASNITYYSFAPTVEISAAQILGNEVILTLGTPLEEGVVYDLTIQSGITNCIGEALTQTTQLKYGLAVVPEAGDVVINEILFNPATGEKDYVELLNISNKIINIKNLTIANLSREDDIEPIISSGLLFPNSHIALAADPISVRAQYEAPDSAWVIKNKLPSFNDESGNITLIHNGDIIDEMDYDEDMHISFLTNKDGVALERINPYGKSSARSNWISGASNTNYGTPGYQNGQFSESTAKGEDYVEVIRKICSPDGDGFEDFVLMQYNLPEPGYILNAKIFNQEGQTIHRLSNNELVGKNGQIRWDGVDDNRIPVSAGIYVVRFEFFKGDGEKIVALESCGVVR